MFTHRCSSLILSSSPPPVISIPRYPPFSADNGSKTVFERILNERAEIPEYISVEAKDLIERLLEVDPHKRLGTVPLPSPLSMTTNTLLSPPPHHPDSIDIPNNGHPNCLGNGTNRSYSTSSSEIKKHPYFRGIDWENLERRVSFGPLNPGIKKEGDTHNFYKYSEMNSVEEPNGEVNYDELFKNF